MLAWIKQKKTYPYFDKYIVGYELEAAQQLTSKKLEIKYPKYVDYSLLPYPLEEYAINTFTAMGCRFNCSYCQDGKAPFFTSSLDGGVGELMKLLPAKTLIHFFDSVLGYSPQRLHDVCDVLSQLQHNFVLSCDLRAEYINLETLHCLSKAGFKEIRLGIESASVDLLKKK